VTDIVGHARAAGTKTPAVSISAQKATRISQATATGIPEREAERGKVYTRQGPLGTVNRVLYIPYPRANACPRIMSTRS